MLDVAAHGHRRIGLSLGRAPDRGVIAHLKQRVALRQPSLLEIEGLFVSKEGLSHQSPQPLECHPPLGARRPDPSLGPLARHGDAVHRCGANLLRKFRDVLSVLAAGLVVIPPDDNMAVLENGPVRATGGVRTARRGNSDMVGQ